MHMHSYYEYISLGQAFAWMNKLVSSELIFDEFKINTS